MVPCDSSPVTRVSRSPLPCEKRSAWGGGWGCSMSFVRFVLLIRWKTNLWSGVIIFFLLLCFFGSRHIGIIGRGHDLRLVEDLCMKQFWSVFPDGFLENFTEVWSLFETFLGQRICSYVGELESVGQEWKHKPRVQIKSSKKDSSSKKNDPVLKKKWCNDFRASEVRCYLQFFQKAFFI